MHEPGRAWRALARCSASRPDLQDTERTRQDPPRGDSASPASRLTWADNQRSFGKLVVTTANLTNNRDHRALTKVPSNWDIRPPS
jgi:hypothetical protein